MQFYFYTSLLVVLTIELLGVGIATHSNVDIDFSSPGYEPMKYFSLQNVLGCIKQEFTWEPAGVKNGSLEDCADRCVRRSLCLGFHLEPSSNNSCRTFVFDKCSHDMNVIGCSNRTTAWIRILPGLPFGHLCPPGFIFRHGTSWYSVSPAANWQDAKRACDSELGLAKLADADDKSELAHMQWMRRFVLPQKAVFLGGRRTRFTYRWEACGKRISADVWGSRGEPTTAGGQDRTALLDGFRDLADVPETSHRVGRALCECVDPFKF